MPRPAHLESTITDTGRHAISRTLPTSWAAMLTLEMQGYTKKEIAQMLGRNYARVTRITTHPVYLEHRTQRLGDLDRDFVNLKHKVVDVMGRALDQSAPMDAQLRAADMWFKTQGYGAYSKNPVPEQKVTVEDVVSRLLQVNVQVNVGEGQSTTVIEEIQEAAE